VHHGATLGLCGAPSGHTNIPKSIANTSEVGGDRGLGVWSSGWWLGAAGGRGGGGGKKKEEEKGAWGRFNKVKIIETFSLTKKQPGGKLFGWCIIIIIIITYKNYHPHCLHYNFLTGADGDLQFGPS
jgi:hypothetical protein